jgi:hypothetical protein
MVLSEYEKEYQRANRCVVTRKAIGHLLRYMEFSGAESNLQKLLTFLR